MLQSADYSISCNGSHSPPSLACVNTDWVLLSTHARIHNTESCENGGSGGVSSSTKRSNSEKGPRVRTVLSEQQLQTLRTVYASNPRPDALLKEHLVEITGLNPRVIRVWFQNKRCKDKKRAIQAEAARLQSMQQQQQQAKVHTLCHDSCIVTLCCGNRQP